MDKKLPPRKRDQEDINYNESASSDDDEEEAIDITPEEYIEDPIFSPTHNAAVSKKNIRIAIAVLFEKVLGSPPEKEWQKLKTVSQIRKMLGEDGVNGKHNFGTKIKTVLCQVIHCRENNLIYTGDGDYSKVGRPVVLEADGIEAEIIADACEEGNSLKMASYMVNQYREAALLDSVTLSAVRHCFLRIKSTYQVCQEGEARI